MAWHTEEDEGSMDVPAMAEPPQNPIDEYGEMLMGRLQNAQKRMAQAEMSMEEARHQLAQWRPIAESCRVGLEALKSNQMKVAA